MKTLKLFYEKMKEKDKKYPTIAINSKKLQQLSIIRMNQHIHV